MILLSSPLKNAPIPANHGKYIIFFLEIEIVTTKIVNSKRLTKICHKLLSTMNVLNTVFLTNTTIFELIIINFLRFTWAYSREALKRSWVLIRITMVSP